MALRAAAAAATAAAAAKAATLHRIECEHLQRSCCFCLAQTGEFAGCMLSFAAAATAAAAAAAAAGACCDPEAGTWLCLF